MGVALGSLGLLGPRLRFGVVVTEEGWVLLSLPDSAPARSGLRAALVRFLGVALVALVGVVSFSLLSPFGLALGLALDFFGVAVVLVGSRGAPPRSFFFMTSQEALADLPLEKPASSASLSLSIWVVWLAWFGLACFAFIWKEVENLGAG